MVYERHEAQRIASRRAVTAVVSAFLLTFAALFPIVNPLEGAPFFLGLTAGLSSAERRVLAGKAAVNGFALLLGSMALGPWLLEVFGIQLPVVRIAGGLVVAALGWKLLTQEQWSDHAAGVQAGSAAKVGSFYPLTMPLTVGPGSMSVAITIGSRKPGFTQVSELVEHAGGALLGLIAIALSIYLAYRFADKSRGFWARPDSRCWCDCRRSSSCASASRSSGMATAR